jgi:hypothetical protein
MQYSYSSSVCVTDDSFGRIVYRRPVKRESSESDVGGLTVSTAGGKKARLTDVEKVLSTNCADKPSSKVKGTDSEASAKKRVNANLLSFDEEDA